jgi:hypothetical protein
MGANSTQGWCLFVFLVGFTSLVVGLAYLGPLFSLAGLACLIGSLIGFFRVKPLEHAGAGDAASNNRAAASTSAGMAKAKRA